MTLTNCGNPGEAGRAMCLGNCTLHAPATTTDDATADERPSIAELQRLDGVKWTTWPNGSTYAIADAAPVLLEIVKAAMAYVTAPVGKVTPAWDALIAALAKVRQ
jgi:hypothetical protein